MGKGRNVINLAATKENIMHLMQINGLTAKKVQQALDLGSVQAVYKWLDPRKKDIPSFDNCIQLARLFGCSVEDIVVVNEIEIKVPKDKD